MTRPSTASRPSLVSNMAGLSSLTKTIPQRGLGVLRRAASLASRSNSTSSSGCNTPNEIYADNAILPDDIAQYLQNSTAGYGHSRSSSTTLVQDPDISGINWKFANQGQRMLQQARDESTSSGVDHSDSRYTRHLYIQAVSFLLHGLPKELSPEEQVVIRAALPCSLDVLIAPSQETASVGSENTETASRPILQRAVSSSIILAFSTMQKVVPHIVHASSTIYQYNRDHKVAQNLAAQSISAIDLVGRSGLAVGGKVVALGDGKAGGLVRCAAFWLLDGVTGGLHDGVEEIANLVRAGEGR